MCCSVAPRWKRLSTWPPSPSPTGASLLHLRTLASTSTTTRRALPRARGKRSARLGPRSAGLGFYCLRRQSYGRELFWRWRRRLARRSLPVCVPPFDHFVELLELLRV